jgi:hypothetical protein
MLLAPHEKQIPRRKVAMLETILIALGAVLVVLAVFAIVVALQPSEFSVTRTATMSAPAAEVFSQVNDFHNWEAWSPWAKLDPAARNSFAGAPAGTGAVFTWNGNKNVGEGVMTITESRPSDLIRIKLEFLRPFKGTNTAEFTFKPDSNQTVVTWSMAGTKNFIVKAFGLFMSMDKMVGGQFEQGLANMKSIVESANKR